MKQLNVYLSSKHINTENILITLGETINALEKDDLIVNTTQTNVISTKWLMRGYRIFVYMVDGEKVEMKLGYIGDCKKEIRVAHNLEKMVLANCFGLAIK